MGQTAEILAHRFHISREQMDAFALRSHQRLAAGMTAGHLQEIEPLYDSDGKVYVSELNVRLLGMMFGGTIAEVMGGKVAPEEEQILAAVVKE